MEGNRERKGRRKKDRDKRGTKGRVIKMKQRKNQVNGEGKAKWKGRKGKGGRSKMKEERNGEKVKTGECGESKTRSQRRNIRVSVEKDKKMVQGEGKWEENVKYMKYGNKIRKKGEEKC